MRRFESRTVQKFSLALCALFLLKTVAFARADERTPQTFDIAPQALASALTAFARQSHEEILFAPDVVATKRTAGVKGTMTALVALNVLLKDSGLPFSSTPSGAILVGTAGGTSPVVSTTEQTRDATKEGKKSSSDGFLLAQATPGQTPSPSTVEKQDEQTSEKKKREQQLQEVVVTGSRIPTTAGQQALPVRSYTREDIENSGQTTMGDFLNTLPDVSTFQNSSLQLGLAGVEAVQLHGLPIGTTLTLLDGRRLETNISGFFDLSNIPLAAVERVEILPVGASAVYGADALAGAVNTILRKDFNGFEANATLDHASGVDNPTASLAWGKNWERGSVSLIGSYQRTGELLGTQREPTSLTNFPVNVPQSTVLALAGDSCAPGNVYSVDGSNLPGLSSPESAIPAGITGVPTLQQFAAGAGKLNVCNALRYRDITPQSQRESALLSAHYDVTESVDLFTQVLLSHGHLQDQIGPQIQVFQGAVAANNPYNPFGEAVNVSFEYPGAGEPEVQSTSFIRPLIGVRGAFLSDWHYEATASFSRDQLHDVNMYTDGGLISNALASSNPATALNPFASGAPGTPQLLSSLTNPAVDTSSQTFNDQIVSGQGIVRGPVLQLPAGALQAVIGAEYSQEKQDSIENFSGQIAPYLLRRNTYAGFSEARIPLLAGGEHSQVGERLTLTLAGRYDHSNDYGGKATWQSGLLWRATEAFSFSGSYGQSYEAPLLSAISGPQTVFVSPLFVPDPFRGNQLITYPVNFVSGPNFNLKPETGDSFTLGLQYSSQTLPGLHTSLTWYDLKISNYIGGESIQTLLTHPSLFPGAVIRAPPTPQDQQQGFLGAITQLNDTVYNFGDIRVSGFDADIRYAIDTRAGQFTPSLAIANIYRWQSAILPGTPEIDSVSKATGFASAAGSSLGVGWSPRWKGTAGLAWKKGPLSMNLAGRYIGSYRDYQFSGPNTNEIGNTWIFDFNARYEVGQALASTNPWLARSYVALGAVNLLNKTPPFSYTSTWYDPEEYDIRGRFLHLSVGLRL